MGSKQDPLPRPAESGLHCRRIEGMRAPWLSQISARQSGRSAFPASGGVFYFCQIILFWRHSGVSIRFHKIFTAQQTVIPLLPPRPLYGVCQCLYFAKPSDTHQLVILSEPQAGGLGTALWARIAEVVGAYYLFFSILITWASPPLKAAVTLN